MTIPSLTPLSTPPGRAQDDFDTAMATTLAEIDTMVDQLNLALDAINVVLPDLELVPGAAAAAATATAVRDAVLEALDATLSARDVAVAAASSMHLPPITAADAGKSIMVDAAGSLVLGFAAMAMAGATASVAGTAGLTPAPAAGDQDAVLHGDGTWRALASGASKWTTLAAGTDYTATPTSTSTLTMITNQTAVLRPGMALRYVIGGVTYYGVAAAITANQLALGGAPLTGDVTALYYSIFPGMVETLTLSVPGAWADSADTALVVDDLLMSLIWNGPPASLVRIRAWTRTTDTGTNKPRINVRLGMTPTDYVSVSNGTVGLELAASATWVVTGVDITPAKYAVVPGTAIELRTDANGSNDDARDLVVILTFVYA